jgi:hypothetical protein
VNIAFLISLICFLLAALAPIFEYSLGKFDAIAWGLAALAAGFLVPWGVRHTR